MKINEKTWIQLITASILLLSLTYMVLATPGGPTVNYLSNSSLDTGSGTERNDTRGYIHTVNLDATLQNQNWKAYVGNVTGILTLDDSDGYTIYDWSSSTVTGEVYLTRDSGPTWASVECANYTHVRNEEVQLSMTATQADNINNTFNESAHTSILVGSTNITANSCQTTYTYVNDSRQNVTLADLQVFQEILLSDGVDLIYSTIIEDDEPGYSLSSFDFQFIVAENVTIGTPNLIYYFFVELG